MLGAVLLFQIEITRTPRPAEGAPRKVVPAERRDLSEVASSVQLNRRALDGWVPKKGTPAPPLDWTLEPAPPAPPTSWRERPREDEAAVVAAPADESVNGFDQPRLWFYAGTGSFRRHTRGGGHPHAHLAPRSAPRGAPPGGHLGGTSRRGPRR
jgi:hypothetical protein